MNIKQIASIAIIATLPFAANAAQTIVTTNTPAAVGANETVNRAATSGPYQTATIGEHDDEHIATTAYVKGAYNDTIAAVNKVDSDKQVKLINEQNNHDISSNVISGYNLSGVGVWLPFASQNEFNAGKADLSQSVNLDDSLMTAGTVLDLTYISTHTLADSKQDVLQNATSENAMSSWVLSGSNYNSVNNNILDIDAQDISELLEQDPAVGAALDIDDVLISAGTTMKWIQGAGTQLQTNIDAIDTKIDNKRVEIYTTWDTNDTTQVAFVTASANQSQN